MDRRLALLMALLSPGAQPVHAADPVGQLLDVVGQVEIRQSGKPARAAALLSPVRAGDTVAVGAGGAAELVLFQSGARFALAAGSAARVQPASLRSLSGAAPRPLPRLNQRILREQRQSAARPSTRMLGLLVRNDGNAGLGPRAPAPHGAIRAAPVLLRWDGPVDGEAIRLQIRDGDRLVYRAELPPTARELRVPDSLLRPGVWYRWSVTALCDGNAGPRCSAAIRLLTGEERAGLATLEGHSTPGRPGGAVGPAALLIRAMTYERLGLWREAREAYQAVARMRPGDTGAAAALHRLAGAQTPALAP